MVQTAEEKRECYRRYNQSAAGKARKRKYEKSPHGKRKIREHKKNPIIRNRRRITRSLKERTPEFRKQQNRYRNKPLNKRRRIKMRSQELLTLLKKHGFEYYTGVPDSTLKGFLRSLADDKTVTHRIASNECEAAFLSGAYHVATGKIGTVYMQNAGLGKIVNPITSYYTPYKIPSLFIIGYRGGGGKSISKDEPQHLHMGIITLSILDLLNIRFKIAFLRDIESTNREIRTAKEYIKEHNQSYALVVPMNHGAHDGKDLSQMNSFLNAEKTPEISREFVVKAVVDNMDFRDLVVTTTGKTSRELFEYRESRHESHQNDFLNVGGMGGASAQAMELALQHPERKVYCIDGDGAALMQLGTMNTIGTYKPKNLIHVIVDNNSYESTGNQKSNSDNIRMNGLYWLFNYKKGYAVYTKEQVIEALANFKNEEGPCLITVKCNTKSRKDLGRPTITPPESKKEFMKSLGIR